MKRVGLLTSGTVSPGMNAAIRAAARTLFESKNEVIAIENGFDGFFDRDLISLPHWSFFQGLLYRGGSILGLPQHGDPFNYPVIRGNKLEHIDKSDEMIATISDFKIDTLLVIGSRRDLKICKSLEKSGVTTVFIPNYINNDFPHSDFTIGFKTAVQTASAYLDRLHTTAESHHRVFIVEVLGFHTGWTALESGISGGADVIVIPEFKFKPKNIIDTLEIRKGKGAAFSLIVAARGSEPEGVDLNASNGSVVKYLTENLNENIDLEVRNLSLTLIQRGGSPTAFDRVLASHYGMYAAERASLKLNKSESVYYTDCAASMPLSDTDEQLKTVTKDSEIIRTLNNLNISLGI